MTNETLDTYQRQAAEKNAKVEALQAKYDAEYKSLQQEIDELKSMFESKHQTLIGDLNTAKNEYDESIGLAKKLLLDTYQDGDPKTQGALQVSVSKGKLVITDMANAVALVNILMPQALDTKVNSSKLLKAIQSDSVELPDVEYITVEHPVTIKVLTKKLAGLIDNG